MKRHDAWIALAFVAGMVVAAIAAPAGAAPNPTSAVHAPAPASLVRADLLYNAGTEALARGDVGPAIAFLAAAVRLEPRARDIRVNLDQATAAAARIRGAESTDDIAPPRGLPLSTGELAWIGAILLALGASLGIAAKLRPMPLGMGRAAIVVLVAGTALSAWVLARGRAEAVHPEAVVVAHQLPVERGPDEPSRAPVVLGAGERVRLGRARGGQVEIRVAGTPIGWAAREGLWRVSETPRYTARYATP